jgi:peptidoglycan hydrolase-like protein with peptidoglycan-binding domain
MSQYHDEPSGDHPQLEEFDRGPWVKYAQERLQIQGYEPQDHKIDGLFGPMTKEAVRDFQGHWGLPTTGVIDAETWQLLEGTEV